MQYLVFFRWGTPQPPSSLASGGVALVYPNKWKLQSIDFRKWKKFVGLDDTCFVEVLFIPSIAGSKCKSTRWATC